MNTTQTTTQTAHEKRSYRVNELVPILGLSKSSLFRALRDGRLRRVKVGGCTLVLKEDLEAFIQAN